MTFEEWYKISWECWDSPTDKEEFIKALKEAWKAAYQQGYTDGYSAGLSDDGMP
jgi:DNA phosphorothioation-dependent restriction protein DptG